MLVVQCSGVCKVHTLHRFTYATYVHTTTVPFFQHDDIEESLPWYSLSVLSMSAGCSKWKCVCIRSIPVHKKDTGRPPSIHPSKIDGKDTQVALQTDCSHQSLHFFFFCKLDNDNNDHGKKNSASGSPPCRMQLWCWPLVYNWH